MIGYGLVVPCGARDGLFRLSQRRNDGSPPSRRYVQAPLVRGSLRRPQGSHFEDLVQPVRPTRLTRGA